MKALITGASSGIGRDIAIYLDSLGYELILEKKKKKLLEEVKELTNSSKIIICDLTHEEEVYRLYEKTKYEDIDLLVNNAGYGLFGYFNETCLDNELDMINVNIKAVHILTKLFLVDFKARDSGYILNVASAAGFMAGPYLGTYYATKNYVLKLTMAISMELKKQKSNVFISALCPGPVDTNFNKRAGGNFKAKPLSSEYVAKYAIKKLFKKKLIIIPSFRMKLGVFMTRLLPYKLQLRITYKIQKNKNK
jgi:short-subunit dehydrogenase